MLMLQSKSLKERHSLIHYITTVYNISRNINWKAADSKSFLTDYVELITVVRRAEGASIFPNGRYRFPTFLQGLPVF